MSADDEVVAAKFVQLADGLVQVVIRPAILMLEIGLASESDVQERLYMVGVLGVQYPFVA